MLSAISSPSRRPEEYRSSNIAASRTRAGVAGLSSSSRCAASTDSALGKGRDAFGARTPSAGLAAKPRCRTSQWKKPRQADSMSASERGASPLECISATKRRICAGSISDSGFS
jgi:hypothetical protein